MMPYPPPNHQSLHRWADICDVDEIVAQALHVIYDPINVPPEDILQAPMPDDLDFIKRCCKTWMNNGYYSRAESVNFRGTMLEINNETD